VNTVLRAALPTGQFQRDSSTGSNAVRIGGPGRCRHFARSERDFNRLSVLRSAASKYYEAVWETGRWMDLEPEARARLHDVF